MNWVKICNRIIEYSFYALFLLVPLAFTSKTSELFELNKMWLTWGLTIIIVASWLIKMVLQRRILFQRTPLDIPIGLFLASQIISTIFSLDSHTSLWGYYSRFNGGLLSIISYILLYYAFLSNLGLLSYLRRILFLSLISGLIVALWGLPSHFGYDPTCLLFRGTLDVSCWTQDFMPRVRIFSTLGQPDWLAAYLAILIPIVIAYLLKAISDKRQEKSKNWLLISYLLSLISLFYVDLLYTRARSGFLGIWIALGFFGLFYILYYGKKSLFSNLKSLILSLAVITFVIGTPIGQLNGLTLGGIKSYFQKPAVTETLKKTETQKDKVPAQSFESGGGTESGDIRLLVWTGAINAWKANPLFGTGVETFAFAYYKYKPAAHNLTSEWNFLYNKAHNEYLNYLATTGIFGLGSYLLMIGWFIYLAIKQCKIQNAKLKITIQNSKLEKEKFSTSNSNFSLLTLTFALIAGYISILVTNFFGFSVVITNIYLFMIPAFILVLTSQLPNRPIAQSFNKPITISLYQWTGVFFIILASLFMILSLFRFWQADIAFALGYNLDRAGEYQQAYPNLLKAVQLRKDESVFKDEFSLNNAIIAAELVAQKPPDQNAKEQAISIASSLTQEAINTSNEIISQYQNNVVFWKTRTRLFFTLSQVDSRYLPRALDAIQKASLLAPNDANIWYNLGVLYGQNNNLEKGIEALEKTIMLKSDYSKENRDARYGLGLFYHQKATDKNGDIIDSALQEKAISQMQYILDRISPKDENARKSIEDWSNP